MNTKGNGPSKVNLQAKLEVVEEWFLQAKLKVVEDWMRVQEVLFKN